MAQINLKEEFNHLKIKTPYAPIVCGNKNYSILIDFSDDWSSIQNKIAVFVIDNKKTAVEFSGNTFIVPALPNANHAKLIIMSAESESEAKVTSTFELNLKPTLHAENMKEFKPLSNYVNEILSKLEGLTSGSIKAKKAEVADIALNASNSTLLINGDFKINQRGSTIYNCTKNEYTIDRWMGFNGLKVTKNTAGITISNTNSSGSGLFQQKLEETYSSFAGQALTLSAKIDGEIYSLTTTFASSSPTSQGTIASKEIKTGVSLTLTYFANDIFSVGITLSSGKSLTLTYIKLELGTTPTAFAPRTTAEELALCQRFYQDLGVDGIGYSTFGAISYNSESYYGINCPINLIAELRVKPTVTIKTFPYIRNYNNLNNQAIALIDIISFKDNSLILQLITNGAEHGVIYATYNGSVSLDAEIY